MGWNIDLPPTLYFSGDNVSDPKFAELVKEVSDQPLLAIDTETTGLCVWKDIPLYWSLAWPGKRATLRADVLPYFQKVFDDPAKHWLFANAKYDMHILGNVGAHLAGKCIDTQVMHALLYEDKPHKLKFMAQHILGWTWADFEDSFGKIGKRQSAEEVIRRAERENMALLVEYAANDAWGTLRLYDELRKQLEDAVTHSLFRDTSPYIQTLWDLFYKTEIPYTKVLWRMERHGIKVDRERLELAEPKARKEIDRIRREITSLAGFPLNPNSTPQLRRYFIEQEGLKPVRWTKGGKSGTREPSIDSHFLEHYQGRHKMVDLILQFREYAKLHGTYIVGLHDLLDPADRIHSRFNQDVARTGRLSSSDPNLQNIPRLENDKWHLRDAFIAEPGNSIIAIDYEQLEMRLLACASREADMIDIFRRQWDIHMGNASLMFGIPYEDLKAAKKTDKAVKQGELSEQAMTDYVLQCIHARSAAKNIGFGLNYGMGPGKLATSLGCSDEEAVQKIEQYKKTYPAVTQFYQEAIDETEQTGYAFTILGRRRNVPEIRSSRRDERGRGERVAVNTQIQGSAADVVKMAQILIDKVGLEYRFGCKMLLQVHDELVFECPNENVERVLPEICDLMEHPFSRDLDVRLEVDAGKGASWGSAK